MHAISVKELRTRFPFVRSELKKGTTFLIIHKSKPIGQLSPMNVENDNGVIIETNETWLKDWERASLEDLNKHIPPITKKEHDYYMSLAPKKKMGKK